MRKLLFLPLTCLLVLSQICSAYEEECAPPYYGGDIVANGQNEVAGLLTLVANSPAQKEVWDALTEAYKSAPYFTKVKYVVREDNKDGSEKTLEIYFNFTDNPATEDYEEAGFYFRFDLANPTNSCGDLISG